MCPILQMLLPNVNQMFFLKQIQSAFVLARDRRDGYFPVAAGTRIQSA